MPGGPGTVAALRSAPLPARVVTDGDIAEVIANVALNVFTDCFNKAADVDVDWPQVSHLS